MCIRDRYWGKKDTQTIEKILGMGMTIGVSCAALFTIVAEIIPEVLLHIYTSDPVSYTHLDAYKRQDYEHVMKTLKTLMAELDDIFHRDEPKKLE